MLVVGHDLLNSPRSRRATGFAVLYGPDDVVGDIRSVVTIEEADRVRRPLSTSEGETSAIDVLVRAGQGRSGRKTASPEEDLLLIMHLVWKGGEPGHSLMSATKPAR